MIALGADEVIPEELETSIEIFARVLTKYLVPREDIEAVIARVRAEGYHSVEGPRVPTMQWCDVLRDLPDMEVRSFRIGTASPIAEKTIGALGLRKNWGVTVVALRRNREWIANPGPETALKAGDVMVLFGRTCDIQKIHSLMRASEASA